MENSRKGCSDNRNTKEQQKRMELRKKTAVLLSLLLAIQTMMPVQIAAAMPYPDYKDEEDGLEWGDTVDLLNLEKGSGSNFIDFSKWQEWQGEDDKEENARDEVSEEEQDEEDYHESTPSMATTSSGSAKKRSAASASDARTADKNTIASPSQAFESLEIRTRTIDDEVVKVEDKKTALAFSLKLDNDYLSEKAGDFYTAVEDGEVDGLRGDDLLNLEIVDQWIKDNKDTDTGLKYFPRISFSCSMEGALFDLNKCVTGNMPLTTMSREDIGSYSITRSGQNLVLKCEIDSVVYNRTDVSAYQFADLFVKDEKFNGYYPLITEGEGDVDIRIKFVKDLNDPEDLKGSYKIEKNGPAEINSPAIPYYITASAETEEADLSGKYMIDQLPGELKLMEGVDAISVKVTYEERAVIEYTLDTSSPERLGQELELKEEWRGTDEDQLKKLVFRIPEGGGRATKAVLSIKAEFTSEFYSKYINENGKTWNIKNEAVLAQGDSPDNVTEIQTDSWEGTTEMPFFSKDGTPEGDLKGEKWKWTIGLNPYFTTARGIYLIDCIPDTAVHDYTGASSEELSLLWTRKKTALDGTVSEDGTKTMNMVKKTTDELDAVIDAMDVTDLVYDQNAPLYSYENLKEDMKGGSRIAQALMAEVDSEKGIYYTYEIGGKTQAVFIAPILPDYYKCPVSVSYLTKSMINRDIESDSSEQKQELENEAAVVWEEVTGPGPGSVNVNRITMEKGVTANYSVLDKEALAHYDEKDQILTWEFYVNRFGADLGRFVITDEFDGKNYELLPDGRGIELYEVDRGTGTETPAGEIANNSAGDCFYEIKAEGDLQTLAITFQNITADDCYRFLVPVKVKDPSVLTKQGQSLGPLNNMAEYEFSGGGSNPVKKEAKALPVKVPNTWIEKEKAPFGAAGNEYYYDYENHLVKWKIRINPNHLSIGNAVVTDTLPVAAVNGISAAVTQNPQWESVTRYTDRENTVSASGAMAADKKSAEFDDVKIVMGQNVPGNEITFTFSDGSSNPKTPIDDCYEFIFTTEIKPEYRSAAMIADITTKFVLKNKARLHGYYQNTSVYQEDALHEVHAEADAVNQPDVKVMNKKGKYHAYGQGNPYMLDGAPADVSWIEWEIALNRDGADLSGKTLVDHLGEWCELDTESLKVYRAVVGTDGSYGIGGNALSEAELGPGFQYDSSGFTFQIPEALKSQPLVFKFNAILVDSVKASNMKNEAYFKDSSGSNMSKESADAAGAKNFNFDDFAKASTAPLVRINKGSTNSQLSAAGDRYQYPLQGAVFELTEMTDSGNVWKAKEGAKVKRKTSNASGMCNFIPLKRDVLYQVKEVLAPEGYVVSGAYYYFIIDGRNSAEKGARFTDPNNPPKILDENGNEVEYSVDEAGNPGNLFRNSNFGKAGNDHYIMKMISNSPNENNQVKLTFKKQTDDGQPLEGVEFQLVDRSGKLKTRSVFTGEDGMVTITNLDAGSYFLNEKNTPEGFIPVSNTASNVMASVTVDASDMSNPRITPSGAGIKKDVSGNVLWETDSGANQYFTILNSPLRSRITLQKQSPDGIVLTGAEFILYAGYRDGALSEPAAALRQQAEGGAASDLVLTNEPSTACEEAGITAMAVKHFKDPAGKDRTIPYYNGGGLLDGTYYLKEIKAPDHFLMDENIYKIEVSKGEATGVTGLEAGLPLLVSIFNSGSKARLKAVNQARSGIVGKKEVVWKDNEKQQKGAPLGFILFDLYEENGTTIVREGSEASGEGISREDGTFGFYDIPVGTYMVKERGGGPGSDLYTVSNDTWTVEIRDNQIVTMGKKNGSSALSPILFQNVHKKGGLIINKVDAADQRPLEHVTFSIYPKEKPEQKICSLIYDDHGFYKLPAPDPLTDLQVNQWKEPYLTWQEEGGLLSPALIAGEYEVVEGKPEPGYQNDSNAQGELLRHQVTIEDKKTVAVTNDSVSEDLTAMFQNVKADWRFGIKKLVERAGEHSFDAITDTENGKDGWGFKISYEDTESEGLYGSERISDFAKVKKGTVLATPSDASENWIEVETGDEGIIELEQMLPGTYHVKELEKEGEERYRDVDVKSYVLSVNQKNQLTLNGQPGYMAEVTNKLRRYTISGRKQDETTGAGLSGAVMGLFPADALQFTEENLFCKRKAVSGPFGDFYFEDIPFGTYLVAELKAPEGYLLNQETVYRIQASGMENEAITTGNKGNGEEKIVIGNIPVPHGGSSGGSNSGESSEESNGGESSEGSNGGGHGSGGRAPIVSRAPVLESAPSLEAPEATPVPETLLSEEAIPTLTASTSHDGIFEISVPEGAGVLVEIWDYDRRVVYRGRSGEDGKIRAELPGNDYILVVLDEEGVPLAFYSIVLNDKNAEGLPKTGDRKGAPIGLIAMLILGALLPPLAAFKKKEEDEKEKGIFRGKLHFAKKRFFTKP